MLRNYPETSFSIGWLAIIGLAVIIFMFVVSNPSNSDAYTDADDARTEVSDAYHLVCDNRLASPIPMSH